jgi:hypothetical protein
MAHASSAVQQHPTAAGSVDRSLLPKEHGAWGQLLLPLAVALSAVDAVHWPAWLLAAAAFALFMAHEPLVVWLGQRGRRAAREQSARAVRHLSVWWIIAGATGGSALLASDWMVRGCVAVVLAQALVFFFWFVARGNERSTLGECWLALTLPGAALPVAVAAGTTLPAALHTWASFALAFTAGVFGVRGIIHQHKFRTAGAGWSGLLVVFVGIVVLTLLAPIDGIAALVFWAIVVGNRWICPTPKALRRVGWCLVLGSVLQTVLLVMTELP